MINGFILKHDSWHYSLLLIQLWAYIVWETTYLLMRFYLDNSKNYYYWETNGTTAISLAIVNYYQKTNGTT